MTISRSDSLHLFCYNIGPLPLIGCPVKTRPLSRSRDPPRTPELYFPFSPKLSLWPPTLTGSYRRDADTTLPGCFTLHNTHPSNRHPPWSNAHQGLFILIQNCLPLPRLNVFSLQYYFDSVLGSLHKPFFFHFFPDPLALLPPCLKYPPPREA